MSVARELNRATYALTETGAYRKDVDLRRQMRRASVSVLSNIAEGSERRTDADSAHFYHIAKASAGELRAQLLASVDVGHLDDQAARPLVGLTYDVARMLTALLEARKGDDPPPVPRKPPKQH